MESLDCFDNQLTHLDLSDCENLKYLHASNNQLSSLHFLKLVPNLEILELNNNPKLPKDSLKFIADELELKRLIYLYVNNCLLEGSLKPLKKLNKLEQLDISNTNLSEGLEYLPESLENIWCNSDHSHKSIQIVKELEKHLETKKYGHYYDFSEWRKNKRNSVANTVPLEKLYVIRGNLMRFLNKWGVKKKDNVSELSKLKNPNDYNWQRGINSTVQWANRATSVVGGSLLLVGTSRGDDQYTETGGVIAIVAPFAETVTSYINDKILEARQTKWDELEHDLEDLLNNYHELLGIIETIVIGKKGEVNEALQELEDRIEVFLTSYDEDKNRMIDSEELKTKKGKDKLAKDLNNKENNQLQKIIESIEKVKEEVIKYHRRNENEKELPELVKTREITKKYKKILAEGNSKELEKQKQEKNQESQLKSYQQIKKQLEEQMDFLSQKEQSTDEESELSKETTELLSIIEKNIAELEEYLAKDKEKEIKNLTFSETWWEKGKKIFCCGKDKNEPSIKENFSLTSEKSQELQEFIDNQEEIPHTAVKVEEDIEEYFAKKDKLEQEQIENEELIAQQETLSKGNN